MWQHLPAEQQRAWLETFAGTGQYSVAAKEAGVTRLEAMRWRSDPVFQAAFEEAKKLWLEAMNDELVERSRSGAGDKASAACLQFLLRGEEPQKHNPALAIRHRVEGKVRVKNVYLHGPGEVPERRD